MSIFTSKTKKGKKAAPAAASATPEAAVHVGHAVQALRGIFPVQRPFMSEKAHRGMARGAYVFIVNPSVNKGEVKRYVENRYKVNVVRVNITNVPPKTKQFRNRSGSVGGRKKATVQLRKGQQIDIT